MSKESIAASLKRLRLKSGLTADEVGNIIGKNGKTVNGWENARSLPDVEIFLRLCDLYKVEDIMTEFGETSFCNSDYALVLNQHEKNLLIAYREKKKMQIAVDKILELNDADSKK